MHIIVDVETTGLPTKNHNGFKDLQSFNGARLVSMAYLVFDKDMREVDREYYVIKPENFSIPSSSTAIHGITHEHAMRHGIEARMALRRLGSAIRNKQCVFFIAHNVSFDVNVLLSEAYRHKLFWVVREITSMKRFCTMLQGKKQLNMIKYPKLGELYARLTNKDITHAHHALHDAIHCSECYRYLYNADDQDKKNRCVLL